MRDDVTGPARWLRERVATAVLPAHRRWRRLLRTLDLDPDECGEPIRPPGPTDFVICGSPRSGTALLTAALFQPPRIITVMEPWDALRMQPADLFASLRDELATTRTLSRGRLDVARLIADGSVEWCRDGERPYPVHVDDDYLLGVKFPAFWRYLGRLPDTKFLVCVRHPAAVIHSFRSTGGALSAGLDYEVPFNRQMNRDLRVATNDPAVRRVLLYDYINEHVIKHLDRPNVMPVRYERWFDDPERLMGEIGDFLGVRLEPLRPALRTPRSAADADPGEASLLRRYCRTAEPLGYAL